MEEDAIVRLTRAEFDRLLPRNTQAVIVAELEEDQSDMMTDYHGSRTLQAVIIGFSGHARDLFPEMRQAAAQFPPTAHLGPGRDLHVPRVVFKNAITPVNGKAYWQGSHSHWHRELYGDSGEPPTFTTRAEADAFITKAGEPEAISFDGQIGEFTWTIESRSIEHREKWSMGHGYYLAGRGGKYSDWQVRKRSIKWGVQGSEIAISAHLVIPRCSATAAGPRAESTAAPAFTVNRSKGGVELRFPSKPAAAILDELKAHGWRWSRFASCWYHHDNPQARQLAARLTGTEIPGAEDGHAPDLDAMIDEANTPLMAPAWGD